MRKIILFLIPLLMAGQVSNNVQTASTSGVTLVVPNLSGSKAAVFQYTVSGNPTTETVVVNGCDVSDVCSQLDTYTTSGNGSVSRSLAPAVSYHHYNVLPTWSGGTAVRVVVETTIPKSASTGGGSTLPATTSILKGDGSGGAAAAVADTDYQSPLGYVLPSTVFPSGVLAGSKSLATLDQIPAQTQSTGYQPNQVLSGCGVDYLTGLTYQIGSCTFTVNGGTYTTAAVQKTLSAANSTNPRIDAIGVGIDSSGTPNVFVTTGTPAANPSAPVVDSSTAIGLSFPQVNAAQTTPANTTKTTLFDIGTEWTFASTAHIAISTVNPYSETHDIEATAAVLGNNFTLIKPTSGTEDLSTRNNLVFYIRSKAAWPTGNSGGSAARTLSLWWQNGTTQVGSQVVIRDGQFGFSSSNTSTYQLISIPVSLFATSTNLVTTLVGQITGNTGTSSIGFYLDAISLQGGIQLQTLPTTLMNFKGTYSSSTAYSPNDLVIASSGISYVALAANTNQVVTNTTYWKPLSTSSPISAVQVTGITRALGTTYQNTSSYPLAVFATMDGANVYGQNSVYVASSSVSLASSPNFVAFTGGTTQRPVSFMVPAGYYYQVATTNGSTSGISIWTEWQLQGSGSGSGVSLIASGATALGTSAIASGACASAVTVSASGVLTTDVVSASFNGDPTAVTGYIPSTSGMLAIVAYPTANNVNFKACNNTGSSITPGAITLNWRVTR